ncbi:CLM7 protein, partial [Cisticola juncidis]|nr:CLM7 protein [Cisticola juncidis]
LQGQAPEAQRRREGGTLSVKCPYTKTEAGYTKYWCLLTPQGACQRRVSSYYGKSNDGRTTVKDDSSSRTVSITMTGLKAEDSGTYLCAVEKYMDVQLKTFSLNVFTGWAPAALSVPGWAPTALSVPGCSGNTFIVLSVVLLILLLLALLISAALAVRHSKLLGRTGNREAEDTSDRAEGTAQPGSSGRRESSQAESKGPSYINLDVQPSPEDPLYCNLEPSPAPRNPQHVEYAVIAFSQSPRSSRE